MAALFALLFGGGAAAGAGAAGAGAAGVGAAGAGAAGAGAAGAGAAPALAAGQGVLTSGALNAAGQFVPEALSGAASASAPAFGQQLSSAFQNGLLNRINPAAAQAGEQQSLQEALQQGLLNRIEGGSQDTPSPQAQIPQLPASPAFISQATRAPIRLGGASSAEDATRVARQLELIQPQLLELLRQRSAF